MQDQLFQKADNYHYIDWRIADFTRRLNDFLSRHTTKRKTYSLKATLEQQVSLLSARATFTRLTSTAGKLTPEHALELTDTQYRAAGVSRQKTRYIRDLSECILNKTVRIGRLPHLDDENVREHLTKVKGIGLWTADVYLLISLQRSDIWPVGDIALQAATHDIKGLEARPNPVELSQIGEQWRPWRSVAARILWHYYLSKSGKK